jgi:hypothetical protein
MPVKSLIPREVKEDGIELDGHFLRYIHYITYFSKIKGIIIFVKKKKKKKKIFTFLFYTNLR